jgi:hypothetical protein
MIVCCMLIRATPRGPCYGRCPRDWCDELLTCSHSARRATVPGPNNETLACSRWTAALPLPCTGDQPAALFAFSVPTRRSRSSMPAPAPSFNARRGRSRCAGRASSPASHGRAGQVHGTCSSTVNGAASAGWVAEQLGLDPRSARPTGRMEPLRDAATLSERGERVGAPYWVSDFPARFIGDGAPEARWLARWSIAFLLRRCRTPCVRPDLRPPRSRDGRARGWNTSTAFYRSERLANRRPHASGDRTRPWVSACG